MQHEFKDSFDDFFNNEKEKLRVTLELKLNTVKNSREKPFYISDNLIEFKRRFKQSSVMRVYEEHEENLEEEN